MVTAADVAVLRQANGVLVARMRADLDAFWTSLDLTRPERARDELLRFVTVLADVYGESAAVVAAEWYDELRAAAAVAGTFRARPADLVPAEHIQASARYAAGGLFTDEPGAVLAFVAGAMHKHILQPGRDTITRSTVADPQASGWQRLARPGGCRFCVMLAQRGAVYKKATARFSAHYDCNCASAPSWDPTAPEVDAMAYTASQRTSRMTPEQREIHNERVRDWMDRNADQIEDYRHDAGLDN